MIKLGALRLTSGNCFAALRRLGFRKKRSRHFVPLCGFAPPHFTVAGLCFAKPLFATAKHQLPVTESNLIKTLRSLRLCELKSQN